MLTYNLNNIYRAFTLGKIPNKKMKKMQNWHKVSKQQNCLNKISEIFIELVTDGKLKSSI